MLSRRCVVVMPFLRLSHGRQFFEPIIEARNKDKIKKPVRPNGSWGHTGSLPPIQSRG